MQRVWSGFAILVMCFATTGMGSCGKKTDEKTGAGDGGKGGGSGLDPTMIQAPGYVTEAANKDVKVGWKVGKEMVMAGPTKMSMSTAIVGEEGDNWMVEQTNSAWDTYGKGLIMGLVVAKADGKVSKAVIGKKGEAGKAIKVAEAPPPAKAEKGPEGEDCEVEVKAGKFKAKKYTMAGGVTSWVGTEGLTKDRQIKMDSAASKTELVEQPAEEEMDCGGTKAKCVKLAYTGDTVYCWTEQEVIKAMASGMCKMKTPSMTLTVNVAATDAKPELKWGK
jgi:hypothetical protein